MTATEREKEFYKEALEKAQEGPESTGYGAAVNQKVRFDALMGLKQRFDGLGLDITARREGA